MPKKGGHVKFIEGSPWLGGKTEPKHVLDAVPRVLQGSKKDRTGRSNRKPKESKDEEDRNNAIKGSNNEASKVVEIGANWQSHEASVSLMLKLVLDVVLGTLSGTS
jgi:hypothetical protein